MTIIRWNSPGRLSDIFDDIFAKSMEDIDKKDCDCVPASNIVETDKTFEIQIAVPGYKKEDIQVDLENNLMSVYCDKDQAEGQEVSYTRREFARGTFRRSFKLPKIVDTDKISADYKNGVLTLSLPKRVEATSRLSKQIPVS